MQLAKAEFTHITLAINHLSQLIMAYFGDGSLVTRKKVSTPFSVETSSLDTALSLQY